MPAGAGGQVDARRPGDVRQVALGLPGERGAAVLIDQVPLVVDQDQRPPGVDHLLDDPHVLLGDRLGGVQEHDGDLRLVDRPLGAQHGVVVGAPHLPDPAADAGGVHEHPPAPVELDDLVDGVAGGAGGLVDDDPLRAGDGVEQRGLADIGPAHQRHPVEGPLRRRGPGDGGHLGQDLHDGVEHVAGPPPVEGRDRVGLAQAQAPQGRGVALLGRGVDLVGGQHHRLARAAQHAHDPGVGLGHAHPGVDDEQHRVGQPDGGLRLGGHGRVEAGDVDLPAAGVDDGEAAPGPLGRVGDAVARHPRRVLDDGGAAPQHPVDEGGLADIGPPDDGQHGRAGLRLLAGGGPPPAGEQGQVLLVELVVGQAGAQGLGPPLVLGLVPLVLVPAGRGDPLLRRPHQGGDALDGLLQAHVAGVDEGDALGGGEELGDGGVVAVAAHHLVAQGGGVHALAGRLQVGGAAGQARRLGGGQQQAHVGVGGDDGGDVAPLRHNAGPAGEGGGPAVGLGADDRALEAGELGAHLQVRGHRRDDGGDVGLADGRGDVDAVADHAGRARVQTHVQGHGPHGPGHGRGVAQVHAAALAPPGGGAVHGAGVEVGQAQPGGHAPRDGGLARAARPVDGDDDSHCFLQPFRPSIDPRVPHAPAGIARAPHEIAHGIRVARPR